ncbi:MAG: extracellular solute-binding protein [Hungatella sp.]
MRKKIVSVALGISMAATMMSGCAKSAETSATTQAEAKIAAETKKAEESKASGGEKVKLRMTYWNSEDTMQSMLDYLATKVPEVEIEYQFIDNSNYDTIVDTQLSAGEGPDIICESPGSSLKHARLGYLEPMNDLGGRYSAAGTSVYSYENQVYALPGISWFEGIYYNKDLFEQNNIALPTTFDEYIRVCKAFQEKNIVPLAAGLKSWEPMLKNSMAFVAAEYLSTDTGKHFGSDYRDGKATLAGTWDPYLEKWSEMIKEGVYTTDMTGVDHDQALEQFATGKAAMFCSGPWDLEAIMSKNPELKIDMMPFYGTKQSAGWLIGGPGCGFAVNKSSANKEAALKILDAISSVEGQKSLWENNQGGSSYLEGAAFELPEAYHGVSKTLAAGNVYCPWNEWGAAAGAHETYGTEMQSYLLGTQDLKTTLSNVDSAVAELLAK